MVKRQIKISKQSSFFLFGPRGTGKSTLLKSLPFLNKALFIDLLKPDVEDRYRLDSLALLREAQALRPGSWIIIDEIQKIPRLLDVVHSLIEDKKIFFALTGSSARKLKRGASNMLAGRAFNYKLFPFIESELNSDFNLNNALSWGVLPKVLTLKSKSDKILFLESYVHTYLKEEILVEQLVRNIDPFRLFLPIAAQMNGQLLNYSNISNDTGVSYKTISTYFQILEETLLGYFLLPYDRSVRKVQKQSPKFYFIDQGIRRALAGQLHNTLQERTSEYGEAFESWFITECIARNEYLRKGYQFYFLRTKDDVEVDLIIRKPNQTELLIEIKSTQVVQAKHIKNLKLLRADFPKAQLVCVCRIEQAQKWDDIDVISWKQAFKMIGL